MAGKTVSAFADEETARLVEQVARVEDRPVSQIASAALAFYARLPAEAHTALRVIKAYGGAEALQRVSRDVARVLVDAQFDVARQRFAAAIRPEDAGAGDTEDDLLAAALHLSAPDQAPRVELVTPREARPGRKSRRRR